MTLDGLDFDQQPGLADPSESCLITVLPHGDSSRADSRNGTHSKEKHHGNNARRCHRRGHSSGFPHRRGRQRGHRRCDRTSLCRYRRVRLSTPPGFANTTAPGRRVWAIEGTGSYGAGPTTSLLEHSEWVVEIDRPARPARRDGAKPGDLDAVRAAGEALSRDHLAAPHSRGDREALRVLVSARQGAVVGRTKAIGLLKALIVNAAQSLRDQLRRGTTD